MNATEKFNRFQQKYPHPHTPLFFQRPIWTRRHFFEILGAGVSGCFVDGRLWAADTASQVNVTPQNKAKNCIFILLAGACSHVDTFDLKEVSGVTPTDFAPTTVNGLRFPTGLLPKLATKLDDMVIVRSMLAWAAVHPLAQAWAQIGRSPASALGAVSPNMGCIVALEKEPERKPTDVLPGFLALNANDATAQGYLPAKYAPFKSTPASTGLRNASSTTLGGPAALNERFNLLHTLDDPLRLRSPLGKAVEDMDNFYTSARAMIDHPVVASAFTFSTADSERYGNNAFGNSCLVAKQVLAANSGTHYIQINLGGWDMHQDIYSRTDGIYVQGKQLDDGLSALLTDLKSSGLLNETLVVVMGEFGRTVGPLTEDGGRDHFLQQFVVFAGGGVRGGRAIGSTDPTGAFTVAPGWSRNRDIRIEDVEATLYSALGIDWTKIRTDDPFGRGFEYVPNSRDDVYGPINELWA